jgi:hypothetical protein
MRFYYYFAFLFILPTLPQSVYSQEPEPSDPIINFFLDCRDCNFTFVRQELPFVSFVREPLMADVHILATDSNTGSGGNRYFINFIGIGDMKGTDYEYSLYTGQSDTEDDVRRALLKIIKIGILQYYLESGNINYINIDLEDSGNRVVDELITDRWDKWVFVLELGGDLENESSQNEYALEMEASARKITDKWKTILESSYQIDIENYFDNGDKISSRQDNREVTAEVVKSLNDHWSAAVFGGYMSRSFLNIDQNYNASVGLEYNFFPWQESNRKVFAIRYIAGFDYYDYIEETIYDQTAESFVSEALQLNLQVTQPWGRAFIGLEGRHYFHDFSKNRLTLDGFLSIRLTRNLSVFSRFDFELVHDQMYLPKGDTSLEDLLLRRRKLATTYQYSARTGIQFTFGSIFNNVVNERF